MESSPLLFSLFSFSMLSKSFPLRNSPYICSHILLIFLINKFDLYWAYLSSTNKEKVKGFDLLPKGSELAKNFKCGHSNRQNTFSWAQFLLSEFGQHQISHQFPSPLNKLTGVLELAIEWSISGIFHDKKIKALSP